MEPPTPQINFDLLPDETIFNILLQTDDLGTLARWCQTSRRIATICEDEVFWQRKYLKDYGQTTPLMEGETWKAKYQRLASGAFNSPISAGFNHYGVIDERGNLFMAGADGKGQLGDGTLNTSKQPIHIPFPSKVVSISCSKGLTGAVTEDGKAYLWGNGLRIPTLFGGLEQYKAIKIVVQNSSGEGDYVVLLDGGLIYYKFVVFTRETTMQLAGTLQIDVIDIFLSRYRLFMIAKDGKLYMFGNDFDEGAPLIGVSRNVRGQLEANPVHIPLPEPIKRVSASTSHVVALSRTGNVYLWGHNFFGQLGLGLDKVSEDIITIPQKLDLPSPVIDISAGSEGITSVVTTDGKFYFWGFYPPEHPILAAERQTFQNLTSNVSGNTILPSPIEIQIGFPVRYVSIDAIFMIAVTKDGVVNYWGTPDFSPE